MWQYYRPVALKRLTSVRVWKGNIVTLSSYSRLPSENTDLAQVEVNRSKYHMGQDTGRKPSDSTNLVIRQLSPPSFHNFHSYFSSYCFVRKYHLWYGGQWPIYTELGYENIFQTLPGLEPVTQHPKNNLDWQSQAGLGAWVPPSGGDESAWLRPAQRRPLTFASY